MLLCWYALVRADGPARRPTLELVHLAVLPPGREPWDFWAPELLADRSLRPARVGPVRLVQGEPVLPLSPVPRPRRR